MLDDDDSTPTVTTTSSQTTQPSADTDTPTADTEDTDSPSGGDDPNFAESEEVATSFVELMAGGDYDTAHASLCENARDDSDGYGFADGQALADDFFAVIGATTVTDAQVVDAHAYPYFTDRDVVEFDLETDSGNVRLILLILEEDGALTICQYYIRLP